MPNELKSCPFCEAVPVKDERSSANGYLIPHKKGCLFENYFPRIQEGHVEKWKNISTTRPNQEDLAEKLLKEYKEALWDATLHFTMKTFSTRPCSTCNTVSKLIGKDFGCVKLSKRQGGS